eukprot:GHVU01192728.1.p1 GENE.GHVU01192728.1~~GHVU01192728.1.p1  ORF type:complete len:156 (+),score=18.13 GHVU01192728.1:3294-3761(+)
MLLKRLLWPDKKPKECKQASSLEEGENVSDGSPNDSNCCTGGRILEKSVAVNVTISDDSMLDDSAAREATAMRETSAPACQVQPDQPQKNGSMDDLEHQIPVPEPANEAINIPEMCPRPEYESLLREDSAEVRTMRGFCNFPWGCIGASHFLGHT